MFWTGFLAGSGICCVATVIGIYFIGSRIAKDKNSTNDRLFAYWDSTSYNMSRYVAAMEDVARAIRGHKSWQEDPALDGFRKPAFVATPIEGEESA